MGTKRAMTSIESDQKTHSVWRKGVKRMKRGGNKPHSCLAVVFCVFFFAFFYSTAASLYPHRGLSASLASKATLIPGIIPVSEYKAKNLIPANLCLD